MCSMCMSTPCNPRCPNAPERKAVKECAWCHEGIFSGEMYFDSPVGVICEECLSGMAVQEYLEFIGELFSIAS